LADVGVAETTVLDFTLEVAQLEPEAFAAQHLADASVVVAGADFRFGRKRSGDLELLERLGYEVERPTYESLFRYPDRVRKAFESASG
jgi:FAD synthase